MQTKHTTHRATSQVRKNGCQIRCRKRAGATAVEFSIVAGVLLLFFFAMLEYCRVASTVQAVELALYEGGRKGVIAGATAAEVEAEALSVLTISRVAGTVEVTPAVITDSTDEVTVRIRVNLDQGLFGPVKFMGGKVLDRSLSMKREGSRT
jgi:Flp pilus assembly protein TadG